MAVLAYNRIYLPFCDLSSFRMEAVYDEEGQTDRVVTKFDVAVNCLITADAIDMFAPEFAGSTDDPAALMAVIQERLLTPRKKLSFCFNEFEFIPQPAGVNGFIDAMNGPKPQSFVPVRMDEVSWWCSYRIVAHYVVSYHVGPDPDRAGRVFMTNLPGNVCLYNRWDESVSIDNCQYSTRTRRGKFMIRSDNQEGFIADQVRTQMAAVGVPKGFLRHASHYTVSPDGLGLSYHVVDREVFETPPAGTFQADGHFTVQSSKGDGKRVGTCTVWLRGPKYVPRLYVQQRAVNLCAATLNLRTGNGTALFANEPMVIDAPGGRAGFGAMIMLGATLTYKMFDNSCSCTMTAMLKTDRGWLGAKRLQRYYDPGAAGGVSNNPQPTYHVRGNAGLLLQAAAYYDPTVQGVTLAARDGPFADEASVRLAGGHQLSEGTLPGLGGVEGD